MNSNEIRQPPGVLRCLEEMREKQNALNTKRLELLNSLRFEKECCMIRYFVADIFAAILVAICSFEQ